MKMAGASNNAQRKPDLVELLIQELYARLDKKRMLSTHEAELVKRELRETIEWWLVSKVGTD